MRSINFLTHLLVLLAIIGMVLPETVNAQTVRAKVTLQADRLQPEDQDLLRELPRQLEDYINTYNWSEEHQDIIIDCRLSFVIETFNRRGGEKLYRGQFVISSPSGENMVDRAYEFVYQRGQFMDHNRPLFDPLLSLIDYYIYMVIAGELDTYILLGGSFFYDKAANIADEALVSNYPLGWRYRLDEVKLITDADHRSLREAKFYYYECLFYIEVRKNAARARELAKKVVDLLEKTSQRRPNSSALKRFFDAHYQEFCSLFVYDTDRRNIQKMMQIDNRHMETYQGCGKEVKQEFR